uniref:Uncharacterized protein n=1 Tax=viral metagenome TaxID=1070528 RepID=A0A6M3X832_9ZZZZ
MKLRELFYVYIDKTGTEKSMTEKYPKRVCTICNKQLVVVSPCNGALTNQDYNNPIYYCCYCKKEAD